MPLNRAIESSDDPFISTLTTKKSERLRHSSLEGENSSAIGIDQQLTSSIFSSVQPEENVDDSTNSLTFSEDRKESALMKEEADDRPTPSNLEYGFETTSQVDVDTAELANINLPLVASMHSTAIEAMNTKLHIDEVIAKHTTESQTSTVINTNKNEKIVSNMNMADILDHTAETLFTTNRNANDDQNTEIHLMGRIQSPSNLKQLYDNETLLYRAVTTPNAISEGMWMPIIATTIQPSANTAKAIKTVKTVNVNNSPSERTQENTTETVIYTNENLSKGSTQIQSPIDVTLTAAQAMGIESDSGRRSNEPESPEAIMLSKSFQTVMPSLSASTISSSYLSWYQNHNNLIENVGPVTGPVAVATETDKVFSINKESVEREHIATTVMLNEISNKAMGRNDVSTEVDDMDGISKHTTNNLHATVLPNGGANDLLAKSKYYNMPKNSQSDATILLNTKHLWQIETTVSTVIETVNSVSNDGVVTARIDDMTTGLNENHQVDATISNVIHGGTIALESNANKPVELGLNQLLNVHNSNVMQDDNVRLTEMQIPIPVADSTETVTENQDNFQSDDENTLKFVLTNILNTEPIMPDETMAVMLPTPLPIKQIISDLNTTWPEEVKKIISQKLTTDTNIRGNELNTFSMTPTIKSTPVMITTRAISNNDDYVSTTTSLDTDTYSDHFVLKSKPWEQPIAFLNASSYDTGEDLRGFQGARKNSSRSISDKVIDVSDSGSGGNNESIGDDTMPTWPVKHSAIVEGDVILGGLMMVHSREDTITCGPIMPQGGIQALEVMLFTLDRINEAGLLPNISLGAHILDDCDKDTYGLEMAVDFIKGESISINYSG